VLVEAQEKVHEEVQVKVHAEERARVHEACLRTAALGSGSLRGGPL
jgi:type IV secretory pathway VirD2 relaxase